MLSSWYNKILSVGIDSRITEAFSKQSLKYLRPYRESYLEGAWQDKKEHLQVRVGRRFKRVLIWDDNLRAPGMNSAAVARRADRAGEFDAIIQGLMVSQGRKFCVPEACGRRAHRRVL